MTSPGAMRVEDRGDHLPVTLDNPGSRNALSPDACAVLGGALTQATSLGRIGDVILTRACGYFCAGGDLNALATRAARFDQSPAAEGATDAL